MSEGEQPTCGELATDLCWLLTQASHTYATEIAAALEPLELGARGYCVLSAAAGGGSFTQTELANAIGIDKTTMVDTVDNLERLGLAKRKPSPTDRRAHVIAITPAGRRRLEQAKSVIATLQDEVLSSLGARGGATLMSALAELVGGRLAEPTVSRQTPRRRAAA